jgi:hypothetical protein
MASPRPLILAFLAALALLGVTVDWMLGGGPARRPAPTAVPAPANVPPEAAAPSPPEPLPTSSPPAPLVETAPHEAPAALPPPIEALAEALALGDSEAARAHAARLRAAIRAEPALLEAAIAALLDGGRDEALRGALAWILGTLHEAEEHLLQALAEARSSPELGRWLIHALGAWKGNPDLDDRFGFEADGPWVVEGPGGLRLPIRHAIDRPDVVAALAPYLRDAAPALRRAAVEALRHSLDLEELRQAFVVALETETVDAIQAEGAAALGAWTLAANGRQAEAAAIRASLLRLASAADKEMLRLKVEPVFRSATLSPGELEILGELVAAPAADFGSRYFTIEVAGAQAPALLADPRSEAAGARLHDFLLEAVAGEADAKLREKAAEQLGALAGSASARALIAALQSDPAWHVRLAAARALRQLDAGEAGGAVEAALGAAAKLDRDERVRAAAASARGKQRP